jgi:Sap, sulfolipid-1-addressing protein
MRPARGLRTFRDNVAGARRRDRRPAPSALAVALSPIPIVAVVLVLGASHARTSGPAFALGWIAGLTVVSSVVVLLLETAATPRRRA